MNDQWWRPIVYARTLRADKWWRAIPEGGLSDETRVAVLAVIGGGVGLQGRPRFLLSQNRFERTVGVACMAKDLGTTMHSDEWGRPAYCFVGWSRPTARSGGPELGEFLDHYREWAAKPYEAYVSRDWTVRATALTGPADSTPVAAPWIAVPRGSRRPLPPPGVWPTAEAEQIWDSAVGSPQDLAVAVGWATSPSSGTALSHVIVDSIQERRNLPVPVPRPQQQAPERHKTTVGARKFPDLPDWIKELPARFGLGDHKPDARPPAVTAEELAKLRRELRRPGSWQARD